MLVAREPIVWMDVWYIKYKKVYKLSQGLTDCERQFYRAAMPKSGRKGGRVAKRENLL